MPDNRSSIKHYRKHDHHINENSVTKRRRLSDSIDIEVPNQKNLQQFQDKHKVTETNINNNKPCYNSNVISDENVGSASTLAFRPWGSHKDVREDDRLPYNYPNDNANSTTSTFKGIPYQNCISVSLIKIASVIVFNILFIFLCQFNFS